MLKMNVGNSFKRFVRYFSRKSVPKVVVQFLPSRSLVRIAGTTAAEYLQGLITNDIKHITEGASSMYAMFLNTKGRVLYDSIIYKTDEKDIFLVECDATVAGDLETHLKKFKVRRKLDIAVSQDLVVYNVNDLNFVNNLEKVNSESCRGMISEHFDGVENIKVMQDPRISALGLRALVPVSYSICDELQRKGIESVEGDYYRQLRMALGVGEGIQDFPVGSCFPLEANCDYMHGVSFHKGCYIGQELTARTYHTGVIRKRYMPLIFDKNASFLENDAVIKVNDKPVGKVKSVEENFGLGLLRTEEVLKADHLLVGDNLTCRTYRPFWWPAQAPKELLKQPQIDMEEDQEANEEKKPVLIFRCYVCNMEETYDYMGRNPPDSKYVILVEDSFVKKDPFSHPREKQFLILGSNCCVCHRAVCQAPDCSLFYSKRYCLQCASARKSSFPEQLRKKIKD